MSNIQNQNEELWRKHEDLNRLMIEDTVGYSRKNLLNNTASTITASGLTFTVNSDKSITVSGTVSSSNSMSIGTVTLPKGKYIISGVNGGSDNTYFLYVHSPYVQIEDGEKIITLTEDKTVELLFRFTSGATINTTIYPMIRYASIEDSTFEPYVEDVQTQIDEKISKNLFTTWASLPYGTPTQFINGNSYELGFATNRVFFNDFI